MPGSKTFNEYVEYIDREDVVLSVTVNRESDDLNDFDLDHSYLDYMGDEEKQGSLFTEYKDEVGEEEKKKLKKQFALAQENGSPLWQDVISFDNKWLEQYEVYDATSKQLNEDKLKNVVRESVNEMLKAEQMEESAVWTAAIHYNTDNIHVHIATVEPEPTRKKQKIFNKDTEMWEEQYRAKRKQSSLDKMKSKVANMIVDRSKQRNRIDGLIRGAVADKRERTVKANMLNGMGRQFLRAIEKMPSDKRQWMYAYQSVNEARPHIDAVVDMYLEKYHKKEMKELHLLLDEEVEVMKELYGEGSDYKKYKQTKLDDLKKRMGNAVITEMKNYQKKMDASGFRKVHQNRFSFAHSHNWQQRGELDRAIRQLNFRMRKTYHDFQKDRNLEEFDRMLDGYE